MNKDEQRPLLGSRRPSLRNERPLHQRRLACVLILLAELLERLAFYATSFNLVMFLNQLPLSWSLLNASNAELFLSSFAFGFCFVAGYIADAKLGRFRTIVIFYVVLIIGYALLIMTDPKKSDWLCRVNDTIPWTNTSMAHHRTTNYTPYIDPTDMDFEGSPPCQPSVYLSLLLIGVGTAAVRTNVAPFGADQVRSEGPESMRMFFNWLYWSINLGSLIAIFCVTYIDQEVSFFWGFTTTLIVIVISLFIFSLGYRCYVMRRAPGTKPLRHTVGVVCNAMRNKRRRRNVVVDEAEAPETGSIYPALPRATSQSDLTQPKSLLDYAMHRHGGKFYDQIVEDTKFFFRIMLLFASIIPYWTVYFQMNTTYLLQGLHMRITNNCTPETRIHDNNDFHIPPVWLSAFDIICTIIFIPIVDRLIYRKLDKLGYPLSLRTRMAIGMVFTILSVMSAGILEHYRLAIYWEGGVEHPCVQILGNTNYYAADLSVFYQIPQYALIGISEIFTSIAGMELAYAAAPKTMQGITMGLFLLFSGLGALIGVGTMYCVHDRWIYDWDNGNINCRFACPDDPSEVCAQCHLDYYFYFLAVFQLLGLVLFLLFSKWLKIGYICPGSDNSITNSVNRRTESVRSVER